MERGVDYGDGTREWVGLGYFRIDTVEQDRAPLGSVKISGSDRISRMMDNRTLWQAPATLPTYPAQTVKVMFDRWVIGDPYDTGNASQDGYGIFLFRHVPINWIGLNPNSYSAAGVIIEDSTYEAMQNRLSDIGSYTMRFNERGELDIISTDTVGKQPVYTVTAGVDLVEWSRKLDRSGVSNIVTVASSDPEFPDVYYVGYNQSPMFGWTSGFGQVVSRFSSPLLKSRAAAESASITRLQNSAYPSVASSIVVVPNPALEPLDVVNLVDRDGNSHRHWVESMTVPLDVESEVTLKTFDNNSVEVIS